MSRIFCLTVLSPKYGSLHTKVTLSVNSVQHSRLSFGCHVRLNSQSPRPWTQQKFCSPYHSHMSDWPRLSSRQRRETRMIRRNTAPCGSSLSFFSFFFFREKCWGCLKGRWGRKNSARKREVFSSKESPWYKVPDWCTLTCDERLLCPGSRGAPISPVVTLQMLVSLLPLFFQPVAATL